MPFLQSSPSYGSNSIRALSSSPFLCSPLIFCIIRTCVGSVCTHSGPQVKEPLQGVEHQGQACWAPRGEEEERRLRREAKTKRKNEGGGQEWRWGEHLKGGRGEKWSGRQRRGVNGKEKEWQKEKSRRTILIERRKGGACEQTGRKKKQSN